MAFVGQADTAAADRLLGGILGAEAGVEHCELHHTLGRDLHHLDCDHAAEREAREGEAPGRRLGEHPPRGALP